MPERRICSFTHEEIEPGTGMMFVKRDGSVFFFKDSKARKNRKTSLMAPASRLGLTSQQLRDVVEYLKLN